MWIWLSIHTRLAGFLLSTSVSSCIQELVWSSGTAQDTESVCREFKPHCSQWVMSLGKTFNSNCFLDPSSCYGKHYILCAYRTCTFARLPPSLKRNDCEGFLTAAVIIGRHSEVKKIYYYLIWLWGGGVLEMLARVIFFAIHWNIWSEEPLAPLYFVHYSPYFCQYLYYCLQTWS